ncbi:flavoprotein [Desulfosporosinus sp. SB140]|uniref:flavoprotein n=1 Tax=Desulfosporosinus paludis TaxID=3115649 RepID=UPI003890D88C
MNDELIRTIVRQLLSEPAIQAILQGSGTPAAPGTSTPRNPDALVLMNYVPDLPTLLITLQKRWGSSYTMYLLPSESVGRAQPNLPEGLNWISPEDALSRTDWPSILLPACSLNTLAKMALGIRDNPFTELLGRGIAQGIPIKLVSEHFGLTASAPSVYRNLYAGYLQTVQSYGVRVYTTLASDRPQENQMRSEVIKENNQNEILAPLEIQRQHEKESVTLDPRGLGQSLAQPENVLRFTKKYLADKDAYSFPEGSKVLIPQRTVLSPLARDTLRMRRIELCQEREGGLCY